jgi:hypothetical protein
MSWKSGAGRGVGVLAAALVAGGIGALPARGLSLADLAEGGRIVAANGVAYENFEIQIKGKLTRNLESYEVFATGQGFAITGDAVSAGRGRKAGRGTIQLSFDVSTNQAEGLQSGAFGVLPGMISVRALSVKSTLFDGNKKLGKLKGGLGDGFDELELDGLSALHVRERIKLGGGFGGASVAGGFTAVPEPSTLVLVALGLAGGAALRRSRV